MESRKFLSVMNFKWEQWTGKPEKVMATKIARPDVTFVKAQESLIRFCKKVILRRFKMSQKFWGKPEKF